MTTLQITTSAIAFAAMIVCANAAPAVTAQECSAKFKAAQTAGTLKGMKWAEFRKSECGLSAPTTSGQASSKPTTAPVDTFNSPWGAPRAGSVN